MKRVVRKKYRHIGLFVLIFISIVVGGCLLFFSNFLFCEHTLSRNEDEKKEYSIKLLMVGDVLIHESVYYDARSGDGTYNFKPMIEAVTPIVNKYDLAYYNQETILGGSSIPYSGYPRFNSPQEVGDAFIEAGFNLVSLANNHTMDRGEAGVLNSVSYWSGKKGVVTSGQWKSLEERDKVRIYEENGITYAFFSYTTCTNGLNPPSGKEYLSNVYSNEKAKKDIEEVRGQVDVVIVAMHWGTEYLLGVSEEQTEIANYLASLGVDLIIGTHPHVVEPVEYINDGKTFVIYSLGNFLSGQIGIERLTGLMMEVTIKKVVDEKGTATVSIVSPKAELVYTSYNRNSSHRNFRVFPYSQLNDNILPSYLDYYAKYKDVVSSRYEQLEWGLTGA